jgi:hypothetical protein
MTNSASPDPGLGLGSRRRRTPPRPTQGSDSASASEDDELRLARPRARTRPRLRKTTNSASPDPRALTQPRLQKTTNSASPDPRALTQPRLQKTTNSASPDPGLGLSLVLRRWSPPRSTRGSDSTSTSEDRLDLDFGGATASPYPGLGPTTSQGGIITLPLASSCYEEQDRRLIWLAPVNK